jgi:hypothetical protein
LDLEIGSVRVSRFDVSEVVSGVVSDVVSEVVLKIVGIRNAGRNDPGSIWREKRLEKRRRNS